jgi:hypothetical protein
MGPEPALRDQAEHRAAGIDAARAQKVASPSRGLDADAYRRRGMRPAS